MKKSANTKREKERMRQLRRRNLLNALKLQVEVLCESHAANWVSLSDDGRMILGRMMREIVELLNETMTDDKRASLASIFKACYWEEHGTHSVTFDGNMLSLHGEFDIRELAKRMVWVDLTPTVEEGE